MGPIDDCSKNIKNIQKKSTDSTWRLLDKSKLTYFNVTTATKKSYSKNKTDHEKKIVFFF